MSARFRVFEPFAAYLDYLKRNGIRYEIKHTKDRVTAYIEFDAQDRFDAKEDYTTICGLAGYIYRTENGKETILRSF